MTRAVETLKYTIGADTESIPKLLAFSKKRNAASYDFVGSISHQEAKDILITVEDLHHDIETWLRTSRPEILGRLCA